MKKIPKKKVVEKKNGGRKGSSKGGKGGKGCQKGGSDTLFPDHYFATKTYSDVKKTYAK